MRLVTLLLGVACLVMGAGLFVWAVVEQNPAPRRFGMLYLAVGTLSLLTYGVIAGLSRMRDSEPAEPNAGMALLVALLLTALLSGTVLHALILTHANLRGAERRRATALLRTAATDAAWTALARVSASAAETFPAQGLTFDDLQPSGIAMQVAVRPIDRNSLPDALRRQDAPLFGQFLVVTARASLERRTRSLQSLACRLPNGETRILSWIEEL